MEEDEHGAEPRTNDTAIRVRRDVLANSDIGAILLAQGAGWAFIQSRRRRGRKLPFGSYLNVNGYAAKSFSPLVSTTGSGNEYAERAGLNYAGRTWQLQANYEGIGERFVNATWFDASRREQLLHFSRADSPARRVELDP